VTDDLRVTPQSTESKHEIGAGYGEEYLQWKGWGAETFGVLNRQEEADISAQLRKARTVLSPQSRVLEIGFGNGKFLAYGKKRQWEMHGTEVNAGLLESARLKGFHAVHTESLEPFSADQFDLVAAFDVLEHLPQEALFPFLQEIQRVLKDRGVFIARFPNGDSPFGRFIQHADPTHLTTIGSSKARYFAKKLGVRIIYIGAEAQPILGGGAKHFAYRVIAVPIKYAMNLALNFLFTPRTRRALCSTNLVLAFRVDKPTPPAG